MLCSSLLLSQSHSLTSLLCQPQCFIASHILAFFSERPCPWKHALYKNLSFLLKKMKFPDLTAAVQGLENVNLKSNIKSSETRWKLRSIQPSLCLFKKYYLFFQHPLAFKALIQLFRLMVSECPRLPFQPPEIGRFASEKPNSSEQEAKWTKHLPWWCRTSVHGMTPSSLWSQLSGCVCSWLQAAFP